VKFQVGPFAYTVRVADEPLADDVGLPAMSIHSWSERTIWICPTLPAEQRAEAAMRELARAWLRHVGLPERNEDRAAWMATFAIAVWNEFTRQGGAAALARLDDHQVIDDQSPAADHLPTATYAIECKQCGGKIAIGSVINARPRFAPEHDRIVIDRVARCEHCNLTLRWTETATMLGQPAGRVLVRPS
jgi:hypothetical protein